MTPIVLTSTATAVTGAATAVGAHFATVNGVANPGGVAARAYFQYGPSAGYGLRTRKVALGSGGADVPVSAFVSGLLPGLEHHFRLVVETDAPVTVHGADATFTTGGSIEFPVPSIGDDLIADLAPYTTANTDYETYLRAIGGMFDELMLYCADSDEVDGVAGWSIVFDVDRCPQKAQPYLAQIVGERLPAGISEQDGRDWIRDAPNQDRGTVPAIARGCWRWLTGTRTVWTRERHTIAGASDPDTISILTYTDETPSTDLIKKELRRTVPFDLAIDYQTVDSATWAGIAGLYSTWADVAADNGTWLDVRNRSGAAVPAGFTAWRP